MHEWNRKGPRGESEIRAPVCRSRGERLTTKPSRRSKHQNPRNPVYIASSLLPPPPPTPPLPSQEEREKEKTNINKNNNTNHKNTTTKKTRTIPQPPLTLLSRFVHGLVCLHQHGLGLGVEGDAGLVCEGQPTRAAHSQLVAATSQ